MRQAQLPSGKTTRAFRTIGEASSELGLQPHVLRFWESKFSQIQPMKRGGGRRFYRPEDIEFIRGIKKLLHDEKHPIKDVQTLIRKKGANSILELGRSVERASRHKDVADLSLTPARMRDSVPVAAPVAAPAAAVVPAPNAEPIAAPEPNSVPQVVGSSLAQSVTFAPEIDRESLEDALARLKSLKASWESFRANRPGGGAPA